MKTSHSIFFAFVCALFSPLAARAGFTSSDLLSNTSTLRDGVIYEVPSSLNIEAFNGNDAYKVAENATAVIYIPAGVTLSVKGGNADGTKGAGAGIYVPEGSKLIVTGGGRIFATGGNAAGGTNGGFGGDGVIIDDNDSSYDEWGDRKSVV